MKQPELGQTILDLRKQKGLTQEELVEKCNISVRTIQRIEAGEVTPRSYTVKTILTVLGYDYEKINERSSHNFIEQLDTNSPEEISSAVKSLRLAIIFGVIYFLLGFPEMAADWSRWFDGSLAFTNPVYIALKMAVLFSFTGFAFGFLTLGKLFKNDLLKGSALIYVIAMMTYYSYDVISLYYEIIPFEFFLVMMSVLLGTVGIVFGIAIIRLRKSLGNLATVAGTAEIIMSVMFATVILAWLGMFFLTVVLILQLVLLYKILEKLKRG